jgi:hypothetical protein
MVEQRAHLRGITSVLAGQTAPSPMGDSWRDPDTKGNALSNSERASLDALGEDEAEAIVRAMIDKAKDGDAAAAKAILDRVWPPRKGARLQFNLPNVARAEDLPEAIAAINRQVAEGEISPDEGSLIVGLLEAAQGNRNQRTGGPRRHSG